MPNIVSSAPLAVAPVADTVAAPRTGNSFSNKAIDTSSLAKTRGLYVTNNKTSQRLIDYTENLDGKTVIYSIDDDHDGDQDVYYSLGKVVYRKENHQKKVNKYFITDAPRVYTTADIYRDFFGSKNQDITSLSGDAQIKLSRTNSYGRLSYQFLNRRADAHMRLFLFRSLFQRKPSEAAHVIDFVPKNTNPITEHTVMPVAHVITAE